MTTNGSSSQNKRIDIIQEDLNHLSKAELIQRLKQLQATTQTKKTEGNRKTRKRPYNWTNTSKRHVLLKFLYFGWDYQGYTVQTTTDDTIEHFLFDALMKCCLIEDRETSNYHRCGRTDCGVSALSQVISIDLRSKQPSPDESNCDDELPYCKMLNRLLPIYIRCYAWSHVGATTSARFDCTERSYSYYFPRGRLNIDSMRVGAKYLEGTHDFRNLCKMDIGNGVTEFIRTVYEADIVDVLTEPSNTTQTEFDMMKFRIRSKGFLWHQIRCIMGVLLLVGEGNEDSSIVAELLDVGKHPCKPQYHMASSFPLSLSTAEYGGMNLHWVCKDDEMEVLFQQLQGLWTEFAVKASMIRESLQLLRNTSKSDLTWKHQSKLYNGIVSKVHKPLLNRQTCLSLADRLLTVEKRRQRTGADDQKCKKQKVDD